MKKHTQFQQLNTLQMIDSEWFKVIAHCILVDGCCHGTLFIKCMLQLIAMVIMLAISMLLNLFMAITHKARAFPVKAKTSTCRGVAIIAIILYIKTKFFPKLQKFPFSQN